MKPRRIVGYGLRLLATFWIVGAAVRGAVVAAGLLPGNQGEQLALAAAQAVLAVGVYKVGAWLVKKQPMVPIRDRAAAARSRWWGLHLEHRLAIFAAVCWVVGSFVFLERSYLTVAAPAIGILCVYVVYHFVVREPAPAEAVARNPLDTPSRPFALANTRAGIPGERTAPKAAPRVTGFADIGAVRPGRE